MSKWTFAAPIVLAFSIAGTAGTAAAQTITLPDGGTITPAPPSASGTIANSVYSVTGSGDPGSVSMETAIAGFDNTLAAALGGGSASYLTALSFAPLGVPLAMGSLSGAAIPTLICAPFSSQTYEINPAVGCSVETPPPGGYPGVY